jgi:two-component system, OmpR family, osmolarity sensor histidine kinase EnvZ
VKQQASLFHRTALTVALGLLVFQLAAGLAMFVNLVIPLGNRSANDLADFLVLSARVWHILPPERHRAFEIDLKENHGISLNETTTPLTETELSYPYIRFLRSALLVRLNPDQHPRISEDNHDHFQVEINQGRQLLRFDFSKSRIPPRPTMALAWIVVLGFLATICLSWLLARRVTEPVARLVEAARRIGGDGQLPQLPETGDAELANLARVFNETSRQLQSRRENQATLLAGVSHDLRSPLARMKMALGMLAEEFSSPLMERMGRDISEMDKLIGAQLELARAQEREIAENTDIDALLVDMVEAAEAQAPGRIKLHSSSTPCEVSIAPVSLRRCIGNLLDNALRYTGKAKIQVVRRRFNGNIFIGVRDNGPGITAHLTEVVFRPFYRIESSRNRKTGGSGLGLAITRQLAETHGWKVAIKSRVGGGTSAWLMIPETYSTPSF